MPNSYWDSVCFAVEVFICALFCLLVKNVHDKLLEQRINPTFLVKLKTKSQNVACLWLEHRFLCGLRISRQ